MVSVNSWTAQEGLVFTAVAFGFLLYLTLWIATGYEGDTPLEIVQNFLKDKINR